MGEIESAMLNYIQRRLEDGALSVSEKEIRDALLLQQPEFRYREAFRRGLERLLRRHVINGVNAADGTTHYFIGACASSELRESLGLT